MVPTQISDLFILLSGFLGRFFSRLRLNVFVLVVSGRSALLVQGFLHTFTFVSKLSFVLLMSPVPPRARI